MAEPLMSTGPFREPYRRAVLATAVAAAILGLMVCVRITAATFAFPIDDGEHHSIHLGFGWLAGLAGLAISTGIDARFRVLSIVPIAATGLALCAAFAFVSTAPGTGLLPGDWLGFPYGLMAGAAERASRPSATNYLRSTLFWILHLGAIPFAGMVLSLRLGPTLVGLDSAIIALSSLFAVWAWVVLRRPFVELALELPCRIAYRYNTAGPGVVHVPTHGPCIIIANHAAYIDPLFLAGVAPRPITPMMTATFYDKPIIRQLMVYVFDTIRVPEVAMKRDTNEVAEAIAALDAGKCLVVFPEGWLRRKEDQPLRRFGRGIWQIVAARPDVPIFPCWIEGGWGSYLSFKDGPPGKNKSRDFRRPITVGVSSPVLVPDEVLTDHMKTRLYLMDQVAAAREHIGLPKVAVPSDPRSDDPQ